MCILKVWLDSGKYALIGAAAQLGWSFICTLFHIWLLQFSYLMFFQFFLHWLRGWVQFWRRFCKEICNSLCLKAIWPIWNKLLTALPHYLLLMVVNKRVALYFFWYLSLDIPWSFVLKYIYWLLLGCFSILLHYFIYYLRWHCTYDHQSDCDHYRSYWKYNVWSTSHGCINGV